MRSNEKNYETTRNFFAAPIQQEFATDVAEAAKQCGIKAAFSQIGCMIGNLGFYAEFDSVSQKQDFLEKIEGKFIPNSVWAA